MTFKKIDNGVVISYDNGYTVKLRVEGSKLHLKEEQNGRTVLDTLYYLTDEQAREIKNALKNAKSAEDVVNLLQGALR